MEGINPDSIISFILNPEFEGWLLIVKYVFIAFSILLIVGLIFLLNKTNWLRWFIFEDWGEFLTYRQYGIRKVKIWQKVLHLLSCGLQTGLIL